ncbi:MAG: LacI family DNA-binding transcriptional regulator [Phycisphaerales bacterium]|nr:LacI family DNA-binding transcriptional regulator [Phycisphaerales bacterium]
MLAPKTPLTSVDIARLAGVAPSTISRVLNRAGGFSKQTEKRVLEVVRRTGYRPSSAASSLSRQRHGTIGLITEVEGQTNSSYGAFLIRGITMSLAKHSFRLAMDIVNWGDKAEVIEKLPLFSSRSVDGFVFDIHKATGDIQAMINHLSLPYVLVNSHVTRAYNTIMPDDVDAARQATEHLIQHGHRRIGYFPSTSAQTHSSQENRMKGYLHAMVNAGLQPIPMWDAPLEKHGQWLVSDDFVRRVKTYIEDHQCTAAVTYNGTGAAGVFGACYKLGYRVPTDLSIIACDFEPVLEHLPVRITSIHLDRVVMGQMAVEMLLKQIQSRVAHVPTVLVQGTLREMDSILRRDDGRAVEINSPHEREA